MIIFQWYFLVTELITILIYVANLLTAEKPSDVGSNLVYLLLAGAQLGFFCYLYWR
jgi:uncharacterized membrane protein